MHLFRDTLTLQRNLKIKKRLKKGMSFLQNPLELDLMITLILWSPSSYLPNKEYLVNPSKDNLPKLRHFCLILYNIIIRSRLCHLTSRYRKDPNYENKLKSTGRKTLIKIHFYQKILKITDIVENFNNVYKDIRISFSDEQYNARAKADCH